MACDNATVKIQISLHVFVVDSDKGPVVQSTISVRSLLLTNSLTIVAKYFSNTLIVLLQKM